MEQQESATQEGSAPVATESKPESAPAPVSAPVSAPAPVSGNGEDSRGISLITATLIAVLMSAAVSATSVWLYDRYFAIKIVAVDIKGYISKQRDDYVAGKITEEQLRKSFDALENSIKDVPKNKIILMGDAVVRNVDVLKP